jgi:hypothetical protein
MRRRTARTSSSVYRAKPNAMTRSIVRNRAPLAPPRAPIPSALAVSRRSIVKPSGSVSNRWANDRSSQVAEGPSTPSQKRST